MNPYYQDDSVTLYHGDAREVLPLQADVTITDPPYAVKRSTAPSVGRLAPMEMLGFVSPNWNEKATHSRGYADHDTDAFMELLGPAFEGIRESMPSGGLLVAFCGNRTFHEMASAAAAQGFSMLDILVFSYASGVAKSTTTLRPSHELAMLMRTKGPVRHINPDWRSANHFSIPKPRRMESEHLTTKPLAWMKELVSLVSQPGDTVLDPFCGSGTTLIAARDLGRKAIGVEQDERYCELAAERLSLASLPLGV